MAKGQRKCKISCRFALCFLMVIDIVMSGMGDGVNFALNKPTEQSSTYKEAYSWKAVDGDRNPNYNDGNTCTHTLHTSITWWMVDLQALYGIQSVRLTNRLNVWQRLANFSVEISVQHPSSLSGFPGHTQVSFICVSVTSAVPSGSTSRYECGKTFWGRYIRVVKYTTNGYYYPLSLCEFEAFGVPRLKLTMIAPLSGSLTVVKTVNGQVSTLGCARECITHQGQKPCRYMSYHGTLGVCHLMSTPHHENGGQVGWTFYKLVLEERK